MSTLIDDRSHPPLRRHIGSLLATCASAEIAVAHVRLAALDLSETETRTVRRCRILLGRLEVHSLNEMGPSDAHAAARIRLLTRFLESGRVEIRSAGIGAWTPDFSIYRGADPRVQTDACLIGAHYFHHPVGGAGACLTALLADPADIALALARFERLWQRGHDVLEPVLSAISRRQSFSAA